MTWQPPLSSPKLAAKMAPLFVRGRDALRKHLANIPIERRPLGVASLSVITHADALFHFATALEHCVRNHVTIYILHEDGSIVALLMPYGPLEKL